MKNIYLIDKPAGITSHDVVDRLRKITGVERIGHAGTLDPKASGLMLVAIGRENTKNISSFAKLDKEYEAEIVLGKTSTTYDSEGEISDVSDFIPTREEVETALKSLTGSYEQLPPIFSAKKIKGKKAYELAREGKQVILKPAAVAVYGIETVSYNYPLVKIRTKVSSGTYIRTLAHDIGEKLGTGAYLAALRRTAIGEYLIKNAVTLESFAI